MTGPMLTVPAFTLKLFRADNSIALLIAGRLELDRAPGQSRVKIIGPAGETLETYDVGPACEFTWAVIENPSGHTTEMVRPAQDRAGRARTG